MVPVPRWRVTGKACMLMGRVPEADRQTGRIEKSREWCFRNQWSWAAGPVYRYRVAWCQESKFEEPMERFETGGFQKMENSSPWRCEFLG